MLNIMRYLFFLLPFVLVGCSKNEFKLEFNLSEEVTANYNVTYYATDMRGGLTVQAVASLREGRCELTGITRKPTLLYVTERRSNYPLVIYAGKGDKISVTGNGKDPLEWGVEDNDINKTLSKWRNKNLSSLLNNERDSVNLSLKEFVEMNSDNPASTILMLCYFDRKTNENMYLELMASLRGKAREMEWIQLVARADQLVSRYSYPARLESLVMRSVKEGADTLLIDGKNPVLIWFWQSGLKERKDLMDSIKALKKEFPDSVRVIADISLDTDSLTWRNTIKKDSVEFLKRFWAPTSLADSTVMKLKVDALPFFIVFDAEGNQAYRGKEMGEALKEYRELMKGEF